MLLPWPATRSPLATITATHGDRVGWPWPAIDRFGPPPSDTRRDVLALDKTDFLQALMEPVTAADASLVLRNVARNPITGILPAAPSP